MSDAWHASLIFLWAPMAGLIVSAAMVGLTMSCGLLIAGRTFSCGSRIAGPTEVSPSSMGAWQMASRRYPPYDSIYCTVCGRPMAGPSLSCRSPQDIVRPTIAALTIRPAIGAHKNISEACHAALIVRRPSWRSQNISVACHCGDHYVLKQ